MWLTLTVNTIGVVQIKDGQTAKTHTSLTLNIHYSVGTLPLQIVVLKTILDSADICIGSRLGPTSHNMAFTKLVKMQVV
jgi:hypothetical protein